MIGALRNSPAAVRGKPRTHKVTRIPPPLGGVNTTQPIGSQDLNFCPYTYNMVATEGGLQTRKGYREWNIDLVISPATAEGSHGVRTVVPFERSLAGGDVDRVFAITNEGIWDASSQGSPGLSLTFADMTGDAGFGTYLHYVTDAGLEVMFYADSVNGLFSYDPILDSWAATAGITFPGSEIVADVNYIAVHKQRIWLALENSTDAYYLPVGAVAGATTKAPFGSKFQHGGAIQGLFNWTVDGGSGIDDYLVVVSSAGDVLPYTGSDPSLSDWAEAGKFYIGKIPATKRFGTTSGGELFLLSVNGVVSMNDLLQGVDSDILQANATEKGKTYRVSSAVRAETAQKMDIEGWEIATVPTEGGLLLLPPLGNSTTSVQFYLNNALGAWSFWREVPMLSFDTFQDSVFFGTADSKLMRMDVTLDNVEITPADPANNGVPINYSLITYFSALGAEGAYKRPRLVRPDYLATESPVNTSICRYDFDITEGTLEASQTVITADTGAGVWDVSNWDEAVWGGTTFAPFTQVKGLWGSGRYVAIATRGQATSATTLIGWDLIYDVGGVMV